MDARTIDRVMFGKGLAADPAFQGLTIIIEPIPCFNGCPKGLYYHDTATIVLPPEADVSTLLHEVGHRYGDFYYHDLSCEFAEDFVSQAAVGDAVFLGDPQPAADSRAGWALLGFLGVLAVGIAVVRTRQQRSQPDNPGGNPDPSPAVRLVGVGPPPPRPGERPPEELPRRRGLPLGRRIELITPEEEARIRQLREQGLQFSQIAEQVDRSVSTVWRTIHRGYPPLRRAITPQRMQDAMLMRRMGLTLEEIGRRWGMTKTMVHYVLRRAGEILDLTAAADSLNSALLRVSDGLTPPATLRKLSDAAGRLQEVADDVALLLEIQPKEVPEPLEYPFELGWVHTRALLAEEVLRNGAWCLLREPRETLPRVKERLTVCAEAARNAARGVLENWYDYQTKATQVIFEMEKVMAEARAEAPAGAGAVA